MPFSQDERIALGEKLSQQLVSTTYTKFWFNELFGWMPSIDPTKIWLNFSNIPGAANPTEADQAVVANPTLLSKIKIRLTPDLTSNYGAYIARSTYNNHTSSILNQWLQPSLIRKNGDPSNGYILKLYHGDPDTGGVEINTTFHAGAGGVPCWTFIYSSGILLISNDEAAYFKTNFHDVNGLYLRAYAYIGPTLQDGLGSLSSVEKIMKSFACDILAQVGDPVYYDPANPSKVLVPTNNTLDEPIIGIIESKTSDTLCQVLTSGYSDQTFTGLVKNKNVFLSSSGKLTNSLQTTGWMQIIGVAYENDKLQVNINLQLTALS
jgi:hypothetical protein